MILDRNSSSTIGKKNKSNGWVYFLFILCILVAGFFSSKDKIKTILQKYLEIPANTFVFNKEDVETIVYDFIKNNPQSIINSIQEMQKREYEESLKQSKVNLLNKKDELQGKGKEIAPFAGNKDGDVVVVTFLDYRCGYCRKANESLKELIAKDPKVKVLFKEHPVLGEPSKKLARLALAVYLVDPNKYYDFHNILMSSNDPSDKFIQDSLKLLNIDHIKVKDLMNDPRVNKELASVETLSRELGVRGTPAFIIGDELIPGAIDTNSIVALVLKTREAQAAKK